MLYQKARKISLLNLDVDQKQSLKNDQGSLKQMEQLLSQAQKQNDQVKRAQQLSELSKSKHLRAFEAKKKQIE